MISINLNKSNGNVTISSKNNIVVSGKHCSSLLNSKKYSDYSCSLVSDSTVNISDNKDFIVNNLIISENISQVVLNNAKIFVKNTLSRGKNTIFTTNNTNNNAKIGAVFIPWGTEETGLQKSNYTNYETNFTNEAYLRDHSTPKIPVNPVTKLLSDIVYYAANKIQGDLINSIVPYEDTEYFIYYNLAEIINNLSANQQSDKIYNIEYDSDENDFDLSFQPDSYDATKSIAISPISRGDNTYYTFDKVKVSKETQLTNPTINALPNIDDNVENSIKIDITNNSLNQSKYAVYWLAHSTDTQFATDVEVKQISLINVTKTVYYFNNVDPTKQHYFRIRAIPTTDEAVELDQSEFVTYKESNWSSYVSSIPSKTISQSTISASLNTYTNQIILSFTNNNPDIANLYFSIEKKKASDANYTQLVNFTISGEATETYIDKDVDALTTYYYRLKKELKPAASPYIESTTISDEISITTNAEANPIKLEAPVLVPYTAKYQTNKISVIRSEYTYTDTSVQQVAKFVFQCSKVPFASATQSDITEYTYKYSDYTTAVFYGKTTCVFDNKESNTTYYIRCKAVPDTDTNYDFSAWSNIIETHTIDNLTLPTIVATADSTNPSTVNLTISLSVDHNHTDNNVSCYQIQRAVNTSDLTEQLSWIRLTTFNLSDFTNNVFTCNNYNVSPNVQYYYRVVVIGNNNYASVYSAETSLVTPLKLEDIDIEYEVLGPSSFKFRPNNNHTNYSKLCEHENAGYIECKFTLNNVEQILTFIINKNITTTNTYTNPSSSTVLYTKDWVTITNITPYTVVNVTTQSKPSTTADKPTLAGNTVETSVALKRLVYYYIGGETGSFTAYHDWSFTYNGPVTNKPPVIHGSKFVFTKNAKLTNFTSSALNFPDILAFYSSATPYNVEIETETDFIFGQLNGNYSSSSSSNNLIVTFSGTADQEIKQVPLTFSE